MAGESDKKIILLYVLDILKDFTDENHLMTYTDIINKLEIVYGVSPNVKSIARNIETLTEYGYDIVKCGKNGCYLSARDFDMGEVLYLVDAVYSAKSIPSTQAKELIKKITKSCSNYDRKKFKHIYKVDDIARTKSDEMFQTISLLDRAIDQGKKVSFQYGEYDTNKKMVPRKDGKEYIVNPYFLINNRGKYYLVCNYDKYDDLSNYKIENICAIKILDEDIKLLKKLPNQENFSIEKYINEHIYMTSGESVLVTLKLNNSRVVNDVIDWFGDQITFRKNGEDALVTFDVNEQALIYWALQYGENIEIVSPQSTKEKYIATLENIMKKYK